MLRKQYSLEEDSSNKELDLRRPFSLRRGMKVNMSMIFLRTRESSCPRCYAVTTSAKPGQYIQWCVVYRRNMYLNAQKTNTVLQLPAKPQAVAYYS